MPIKPIMSIAYYAYCLICLLSIMPIKPNMPIMPNMPHPPKNTNGGDTPRAGAKRAQPPFTPMRDASPPFMLEF